MYRGVTANRVIRGWQTPVLVLAVRLVPAWLAAAVPRWAVPSVFRQLFGQAIAHRRRYQALLGLAQLAVWYLLPEHSKEVLEGLGLVRQRPVAEVARYMASQVGTGCLQVDLVLLACSPLAAAIDTFLALPAGEW